MFTKYAVNISNPQAEVQLIERTICIPVGEYKGLTYKEVEHEDIIYAMRRGWIELVDEEPKPKEVAKPEIKIEETKPLGTKEPPKKPKQEAKVESQPEAQPETKSKLETKLETIKKDK